MHLHRRRPGMENTISFPCFLPGETGPLLLELWGLWGPRCLPDASTLVDSSLSLLIHILAGE